MLPGYNRFMKIWQGIKKTALYLVLSMFLVSSVSAPLDSNARVRIFTRPYEFNYFTWTVNAFIAKISETGLDAANHIPESIQLKVVTSYFDLSSELDSIEFDIQLIYADPSITDPDTAAADKINKRGELQSMLDQMSPVVEKILENQVKTVLAEEGLDSGGQTIPPVLYHTTPLPKALIVSPRDIIRQDANISLLADMSLEQITRLEGDVETNLDVSALVVDIGGVGMYPSMVMRSSNLPWVIQTIAHEWTHNYLSLHPLGLNYETSNALRTMNETTAAIVGEEIGQKVIARYYPRYSSAHQKVLAKTNSVQSEGTFDFNAEMHITRVTADNLLRLGKVNEAETYMESRRLFFLQNGYLIRKINQAYFAFYGAYADSPQGAAGADPVGPAVRSLRANSVTLKDFLRQIAWMSSFNQLESRTQ